MPGHLRLLMMIAMLIGTTARARADEPPADARHPVPNSSAQAPIWKALHEQYKDQYAKHEAAAQLALSDQFRQEAATAAAEPARQYVLLREARELAVNAGDFDAAFAAIDDMTKDFTIDVTELKVSALTSAVDRAQIPRAQLFEGYFKVSDAALPDGNLLLAEPASRLATRVAAATRDPGLVARARQLSLRIHDARRDLATVVAAANRLKANRQDPEANLTVGKYLCFVTGQWHDGLPFLAKGSDHRLAELADRDVASPDDPNAMMNLADAWWDLPDTKETPARRSHQRAAFWYQKVVSQLSGDGQKRAQQRIDEVKQASHR